MGLIQTADQLRFSYQAIIQGAEAILNGDGLESFESQVCRYVNGNTLVQDLLNFK